MNTPVLSIQDLSVSFHDQLVVQNLNLRVEKGKTTAIVGESGSGKSVTALAVLGLLPKTAKVTGEIHFENEQLLSLAHRRMRLIRGNKIAMIFQEPMTSLNPVFTVGEQIEDVVRVQKRTSRKASKVKTHQLLEEVGIDERRVHAYPHEFSGGMRQRVMIAMALANEPTLLIADEPTTALDATTARQIVALLIAAKRRREMSMLFISHDLGVVASVADQIYVMRFGHHIEHGTPKQVLYNPTTAYTKALLACRPSILNRQRRLKSVPDDL